MPDVKDELSVLRKRLLDLTMRNRMLAFRESKARTIRIVDEKPEEVYDILVLQDNAMEFLPRTDTDAATTALIASDEDGPLLDEDETDAEAWKLPTADATVDDKHQDKYLQTPYESRVLQRRLFYADKKSTEAVQEQGYTVLFIALGYLEWYESESSDIPRRAPLILVPVELRRASAVKPYRLSWTGEDVQFNISLREKLANSFAVALPDFEAKDTGDRDQILAYFREVQASIEGKKRWRILDNIYVDFFAFAKFVMYKDLDGSHWPEERKPWDHAVVGEILDPSGRNGHSLFDESQVDEALDLQKFYSIMDCDPSQTSVVESAKSGANLAVEGPPGTGKSQTISNLIAELLAQGKSVLFVSEKIAALDVVKRRLDFAGLGDFVAELHSRKANKKAFLAELERTLGASPRTNAPNDSAHFAQLRTVRDQLNAYAGALRTPIGEAGFTPYKLYGMRECVVGSHEKTDVALKSLLLDGSVGVSLSTFNEAQALLHSVETVAREVGGISDNAWRACTIGQVLPTDIPRIQDEIGVAHQHLTEALGILDHLSTIAPIRHPETFTDIHSYRQVIELCTTAPEGGPPLLAAHDWSLICSEQDSLITLLNDWREAEEALGLEIDEGHYLEDYSDLHREYVELSHSIFRVFRSRYRTIKRRVSDIFGGGQKWSRAETASHLSDLIKCQQARKRLTEAEQKAGRAFGAVWKGKDSDPERLLELKAWLSKALEFRRKGFFPDHWPAAFDVEESRAAYGHLVDAFVRQMSEFVPAMKKVMATVQADWMKRFGAAADRVPLVAMKATLDEWLSAMDRIQRWGQYNLFRERGVAMELGGFFEALEQGEIGDNALADSYQLSFCDSLLREALTSRPVLSTFSKAQHEEQIARFRDLDGSVMEMNRKRLRKYLYRQRPSVNHGASPNSEAGYLVGQMNRRRGHLPIRRLMSLCGGLIQKVKPCFMMSPLSVAQFLDPKTTQFDVIIFDEASQVRPEDAIGAILRGKQLVVAGDTKQLPPTSFFDAMADGDDDDEDGYVGVAQVESILHQCRRSFPVCSLKWHYRSKHESLIATSNSAFYNNQLLIYPAPFRESTELGLSLRCLRDTVYDRGRSACNREEARAVAEAVVEHYERTPYLTLGVGTFSVAQQNAVLEQLELMLHQRPEIEQSWLSENGEDFFVKNLETIQGDERDVIYLSIGYGRDGNGRLSTNFGPLNRDGGERRLNVLITRARRKCVVFSNFSADDLRVDENAAYGVRSLKAFLKYAESGVMPDLEDVGGDTESPFEDSVVEFLRASGYQVSTQVGCASFRIDIAVVDPDSPGRYIIGIECDGAMYHSSVVARERDRLRHQVLEGLGWRNRLYRVWSTDWFWDRKRAQEDLLRAVEEARAIPFADETVGSGSAHSEPSDPADNDWSASDDEPEDKQTTFEYGSGGSTPDREDEDVLPEGVQEYRECEYEDARRIPFELLDSHDQDVAELVEDVVRVESPVHRDEVIRRVRSLCGFDRAGHKIQAKVVDGIEAARDAGRVVETEHFLFMAEGGSIRVRRREKGNIRYVANEEIDASILLVLTNQFATDGEELIKQAARYLGFRRMGRAVEESFSGRLDTLLFEGRLTKNPNGLVCKPDQL